MHCPLCSTCVHDQFQSREFRRCGHCFLIFKDASVLLSPADEKARYLTHQNDIEDLRYVKFLSPALEQVKKRHASGARGLDYGSGPAPVLSELLAREGYEMSYYDPFFAPLSPVGPFDFITCTEAAEHFYQPGEEFRRMWSLLAADSSLVLMTELYREGVELKFWYYVRDPTHVCFYSEKTLVWLADSAHVQLEVCSQRVAVFSSGLLAKATRAKSS